MAAGAYMAFGRLVWFVTPASKLKARVLFVPPRWITPIFVSFDLLAFLIQLLGLGSVGAAYETNGPIDQEQVDHGLGILRFGLIAQVLCFGIFAVIGFRFLQVSRSFGVDYRGRDEPLPDPKWQRLSLALNASATLIMVRMLKEYA